MKTKNIRIASILILLSLFLTHSVFAGAKKNGKARTGSAPATVFFDGKAILDILVPIESFSAADRAFSIARKLEELAKNYFLDPDSIIVSPGDGSTDIVAGSVILMAVTDEDARAAGMPQAQLALQDSKIFQQALKEHQKLYSLQVLIRGAVKALLATLFLVGLLVFLGRTYRKVLSWIEGSKNGLGLKFGIQGLELLSAEQTANAFKGFLRLFRIGLVLVLFYFYVPLVLSFFPWTAGLSATFFDYFLSPLKKIGLAVIGYLPNMIFAVVVVAVVWYFLKFIKFIFDGIEKKSIVLEGFYPDWANPTFQIVRFLVLALTAVVIFPYLPGSDSTAFKGVSVFLGLLLSLGSGSAVANGVAGIILTYMRPFQVGDRVMIGVTVGDVHEKTILVTRIHTIKNEVVTIPNSMVLGSHLINYSASAIEKGLVLHTSVTIGYDAPWRQVHDLLVAAAQSTSNILSEPKPFVLQTDLEDFYVAYEINAYTDKPGVMAITYSELHQNIQDQFNKAGVEIMSSHYTSLRDGNRSTVPVENLPKDYQAPGFRISETGEE